MTSTSDFNGPSWADPDLKPDQFLYERLGPWPQPSPAFPLEHAPEVLNIPPIENMIWNEVIGARYIKDLTFYPPQASANAAKDGTFPIPSDAEFLNMMTNSVYARPLVNIDGDTWISSFRGMDVLAEHTLPGTYCAPVSCTFRRDNAQFYCVGISFVYPALPPLTVTKNDPAWNLAKIYVLQAAAYHGLFVVHPALHFPMDTVNAITKSAVPHTHPLFQLIYPHTSYSLSLDNGVLEGPNTVVANNAAGTWFDPLTANGYDIKRLFGAGYAGLPEWPKYYPKYDYMSPWMNTELVYGKCLNIYFQPFLTFCTTVASAILKASPNDTYVKRWAMYNNSHIHGFPDENEIFQPGVLAKAMAIFMWDVTVSHSADHYSFAHDIAPKPDSDGILYAAWKFLRIRVAPPKTANDGGNVKLVSDVCWPDDLYRTEMAEEMFFQSRTVPPNLIDTYYAFTDPELLAAQITFHQDLVTASEQVKSIMPGFIPLKLADPKDKDPLHYGQTIATSVQY